MGAFNKVSDIDIDSIKNVYSRHILSLFTSIYPEYTYTRRNARKPNSNLIKYRMVNLGHELGFRVYANGLNKEQEMEQYTKYRFVNREFLYDIHWYKDMEGLHYTPESISMVAESELGGPRKGDVSKEKYPAIRFDFQKLLVANVELRLMIFKVWNYHDLDVLNNYFINAIKAYRLLKRGSQFLFVCFDHSSKMLYFSEKQKA